MAVSLAVTDELCHADVRLIDLPNNIPAHEKATDGILGKDGGEIPSAPL